MASVRPIGNASVNPATTSEQSAQSWAASHGAGSPSCCLRWSRPLCVSAASSVSVGSGDSEVCIIGCFKDLVLASYNLRREGVCAWTPRARAMIAAELTPRGVTVPGFAWVAHFVPWEVGAVTVLLLRVKKLLGAQ